MGDPDIFGSHFRGDDSWNERTFYRVCASRFPIGLASLRPGFDRQWDFGDDAAIDFQIDFVEMPSRRLGSAFAQVRCDRRSEMVHPARDCLIGDHDAAFRQ